MPDEALTLAYDSTINALREQDSTLSNLRNRATGLLAAAAVGTSFTTAFGLAGTPIALLFPSSTAALCGSTEQLSS
jgi:hypothetical protein